MRAGFHSRELDAAPPPGGEKAGEGASGRGIPFAPNAGSRFIIRRLLQGLGGGDGSLTKKNQPTLREGEELVLSRKTLALGSPNPGRGFK